MRRARLPVCLAALLFAGACTEEIVEPVRAGARFDVGAFVKRAGAGPQVVPHRLRARPRALLLWTAMRADDQLGPGYAFSLGATDGRQARSAAVAARDRGSAETGLAQTTRALAERALSVIDADGQLRVSADVGALGHETFTLAFDRNDDRAAVVHFVAIGGDGVEARVVSWQLGADSRTEVTGAGFPPDLALTFHAGAALGAGTLGRDAALGFGAFAREGGQWANAVRSRDASPGQTFTVETQRTGSTVALLGPPATLAAAERVTDDGLTLRTGGEGTAPATAVSLLLRGVRTQVGTFTKATGSPEAQQRIALPFPPGLLLFSSIMNVAWTPGSSPTEMRWGIGAAAGAGAALAQGASSLLDTAGLGTPEPRAVDDVRNAILHVNHYGGASHVDARGAVTALEQDGFLLRWTPNSGQPTEIGYVALAPLAR